jgi:PAS domain S-box-containing protein
LEQFSYEVMFNSLSEGIIAVNKDLTIILFNEEASRITGWAPHEVIGKKCYQVLQGSNCNHNCPVKKSMFDQCNCYMSHILIMTREERSIPIRVSVMPLKDKAGSPIGAVKIFSDERGTYPTYYGKFQELGLIGTSPLMREVYQLIETVAQTDSNVLIIGKTGTGKELVANAIHKLSARWDKPFVKVNCAALSDTLLESELFGHEKGAFTGALTTRKGRFEVADKGTIFLDEIAEISPKFQAKLLRVIQEGEFERVGSSQTIKVDVRIIVATNKDLHVLVKQNLFRDDLFYRLNVFPIYLPELKKRQGDIKELIDYFINQFNAKFQKEKSGVSEEALHLLTTYDYPGNVRELRNIIEHAFIKCPGSIIAQEHLPPFLLQAESKCLLSHIMQEKEIDYIEEVIKTCQGNKSKAAKLLGISRKTLYNKLNMGKIPE